MDALDNPYKPPDADATAVVPLWRRAVSWILRLVAAPIGMIAALQFFAAVRWLVIESRGGAKRMPLFLGVDLSLGQALLSGAVIESLFVLMLWLAAGRIRRPRRRPPP